MKIPLDHTKITNSPKYENIISSDDNVVSQIKQQLMYGNNTCILVSGYRGTGKTSLIQKLEKAVEDEITKQKRQADSKKRKERATYISRKRIDVARSRKIEPYENPLIFVRISFYKYDEFSTILRKIIRQTALSFSKDKLLKKKKEIINYLGSLYERTFFDVTSYQNVKEVKDTEVAISFSSNLKRLVFSLITFFASLIVLFTNSLKNLNLELINLPIYLATCISSLWVIYELCDITYKAIKKNTITIESTKKSLYDDEIAETLLMDVLTKIKDDRIKIIYIFDELDKIEDNLSLEKLISDLKPIMLSDFATFIIVSGQKLFYKFANSPFVDDALISSIFSKHIHIRLLNVKSFSKIIRDMISVSTENELLVLYIDSLILRSNRIIRRFLNILGQDLVWENSKAYLEIHEEDKESLKTDARILQLLNNIEEEKINEMNYSQGIKDFFITQLYLWIQKAKVKNKSPFYQQQIFVKDEYSNYPSWFMDELTSLCKMLFDRLVKNELFIKSKTDDTLYEWHNSAIIKQEDLLIKTMNEGIEQNSFIESEKIDEIGTSIKTIRKIYYDYFHKEDVDNIGIQRIIELFISSSEGKNDLEKYNEFLRSIDGDLENITLFGVQQLMFIENNIRNILVDLKKTYILLFAEDAFRRFNMNAEFEITSSTDIIASSSSKDGAKAAIKILSTIDFSIKMLEELAEGFKEFIGKRLPNNNGGKVIYFIVWFLDILLSDTNKERIEQKYANENIYIYYVNNNAAYNLVEFQYYIINHLTHL